MTRSLRTFLLRTRKVVPAGRSVRRFAILFVFVFGRFLLVTERRTSPSPNIYFVLRLSRPSSFLLLRKNKNSTKVESTRSHLRLPNFKIGRRACTITECAAEKLKRMFINTVLVGGVTC